MAGLLQVSWVCIRGLQYDRDGPGRYVSAMVKSHIPLVAAALFGAAAVTAQVPKGSAPPAFEFAKVLNDGPESFDDLAGKVVILDFAETW